MNVSLESQEDNIVPAASMKDGDFAVIKYWANGSNQHTVGKIVYRYGNSLVLVGYPEDCSYPDITGSCKVRILKKGEKIVIG